MGFMSNSWVTYVQRTYQQIKDQVLTTLQIKVPEITDHTENNIFVKMIGIWGGIAEMLGYYTDNAAREAFLDSCRLYASGIKHARFFDYRVHARVATSVDLTFTLDVPAASPVSIPSGTEVQTASGIIFLTTISNVIAVGQTSVVIGAVQKSRITGLSLGTALGTNGEEIELPTNLVDNSLLVRVNGLAWNGQDSFAFSLPTDQDFIQSVNEDKIPILRFGDNLNGVTPNTGDSLEIDYYITDGAIVAGAGEINTINSIITLPPLTNISVTNLERSSGGADIESLDSLKKRIPLSVRTIQRAVTRSDYIHVTELNAGVVRAGVVFNCGKTVDIYIIPEGGGIAAAPLIASTQTWIDKRRMLTTTVRIFPAGEVHVKYAITIQVKPAYINSAVIAELRSRIVAFMAYQNQEIRGQVQLSDIYEIIETTKGIQYSDVFLMTAVPYARPLATTTPQLDWSRAIQIASTGTVQWRIIMTSGTQFSLYRANVYMGSFAVGAIVTQPEIVFTLNPGAWIINHSWEFFTYEYSGTLTLAEPSIPISLDSDVSILANGGL